MPLPSHPSSSDPRADVSVGDSASKGGRGRFVTLVLNAWPAAVIMVASIVLALAFSIPMGQKSLPLTLEGGLIETLTLLFYATAFVGALVLRTKGMRAAGLVGILSLLMALREMDAHKAFTTYGVFKTRLYVSPDVALSEKIFAGLAVIALITLLVVTVRSAWPHLRGRAAKAGVTLLGLGGFGVFLKEVDGLPRLLSKAGSALTPDVLAISKAVEETGEMALPLLLVLALVQMYRAR